MGDIDIQKLMIKSIEVELRDLDVLLKKKFGDKLIVDKFTTTNLVPPGENYGSSILKVDALIRRNGQSSEPEELFLVAKMIPATEFQRMIFDSPFTFPKEIYMFKEIIPAYRALEREYGIPESELFDALPEFYGGRLSLDESDDKFDNDAVILMENLKVKNYYCSNRKIGCDLLQAKLVVTTLARFHALGIATKFKKPELFNEIKICAKSMEFKDFLVADSFSTLIDQLKKIPAVIPHVDRIQALMNRPPAEHWLKTPAEPWSTIVHTDLWINNIMFREDANGNPADVKFIDFQNYLHQNPLRDLVFFITLSCQFEVFRTYEIELVDLYYESFISHLEKLECEVDLFPRNSFDEVYADAANLEYMHCMFMIKVLLADTDQVDPSTMNKKIFFDTTFTEEGYKRMEEITLKFIKENWI